MDACLRERYIKVMATIAPVAAGRLTVQDYIDYPDDGNRYELIDGELVMAPSPDFYHQRPSGRLMGFFQWYLEENPIGEVLHAPFDVYLGNHNALQPDLLYISNENRGIIRGRAHGAPDLVVEILSPSNFRIDLGKKREIYQQFKVKEIWFIYPNERKLVAERLSADGSQYEPALEFAEDAILTTPLLPGFELAVHRIFKAPGQG